MPHAKQYALRIETPFGPFFLFTDTTALDVAGSLRNFLTEDLGRAFVPGFDQELVLGAVDANFFDYYRSGSDPFTGTGLINHLEGGIGLFGAYVPRSARRHATATLREAVEVAIAAARRSVRQIRGRAVRAGAHGNIGALSGNLRSSQNGRLGFVGMLVGT